jgi:hypothetical protein
MRLKRPSTRLFVAFGLASLLASVLLVAMYLNLIPDRINAIRLSRAALAESIAASTSTLVNQSDAARIQAMLALIVERNPDLQSAAVRKATGETIAIVGDHMALWNALPGSYSIDSQIQVPILAGTQQWGGVELRFKPLGATGWIGILRDPRLEMIGFVVLASFVAFHFYLGRVLRQLDPSRAIPPATWSSRRSRARRTASCARWSIFSPCARARRICRCASSVPVRCPRARSPTPGACARSSPT